LSSGEEARFLHDEKKGKGIMLPKSSPEKKKKKKKDRVAPRSRTGEKKGRGKGKLCLLISQENCAVHVLIGREKGARNSMCEKNRCSYFRKDCLAHQGRGGETEAASKRSLTLSQVATHRRRKGREKEKKVRKSFFFFFMRGDLHRGREKGRRLMLLCSARKKRKKTTQTDERKEKGGTNTTTWRSALGGGGRGKNKKEKSNKGPDFCLEKKGGEGDQDLAGG